MKAGCQIKYQTSLKTTKIYNSISDQSISVVKTQLLFKKPNQNTHGGGKKGNQTSKTLNPPEDSLRDELVKQEQNKTHHNSAQTTN